MDPVILQRQLRQNANDLQDFCKDLQSWGEEMKRKEDSLKDSTSSTNKDETQPISKLPKISEVKDIPKKPKQHAKKTKKPGPTDYSKWDKFDADLECEKLEEDIEDDSELTDENDLFARDEALLQKEKGNKHVKNKEWDKAIECYTKAIDSYAYDPVYYANRALCYLKKEEYKNAESDCTLSLKLDKSYVKAYQRRSAARENLNMLEYAQEDLLKVLNFEPKNTESLAALQRINKKIGSSKSDVDQRPISKFTASRNKSKPVSSNAQASAILSSLTQTQKKAISSKIELPKVDTSKPLSTWTEEENIIPVKPTKKPIHLRSKKPLKRIQIVEIDNSIQETKPEAQTTENEAIKKHVVEKIVAENNIQAEQQAVKDVVIEKVQKRVQFIEPEKEVLEKIAVEQPPKIQQEEKKIESAFKKTRIEKTVTNVVNEIAWPKANNNPNFIKSDDLKVVERKNNENVSKEAKNTSNLTISAEKTFARPHTYVQFYSIWRSLKSEEDKYKFLKMVESADIADIFKESLESKVFSDILKILSQYFIENNDPVYSVLLGFSKVKRFSTLTLFMEHSDKNCLWKLFDHIKEHEEVAKEDVDNLIRIYEM